METAASRGSGNLTTTESKILTALRAGKTSQQICGELGLTGAEFAAIRRTALRKLDAKSREQLMGLSKAIDDN